MKRELRFKKERNEMSAHELNESSVFFSIRIFGNVGLCSGINVWNVFHTRFNISMAQITPKIITDNLSFHLLPHYIPYSRCDIIKNVPIFRYVQN